MPSTAVSNFHYDPYSGRLTVVYISGTVYDYIDVPEKIYKAMKQSGSKGTFLNKYIKGKYEYEKIG